MTTQFQIVGKDTNGHAQIMAGKMKRPDTFSWHWSSETGMLIVTGLWRGAPRYGACQDTIKNIVAKLKSHGCYRDVLSIENACAANNIPTV